MPGRLLAVVLVVEVDGLWVAAMSLVVATAVAEIDAPDERDVARRVLATDDDNLLVVTAATPNALVEQHLASGFVDEAREGQVLALAEVHGLRMGAPEQPADVDAPPREFRDHVAHGGAGPGELLVGVALPVGEVQPVAPVGVAQRVVQPREVVGSVDEHSPFVAHCPRAAVAVTLIDLGGVVPALRCTEEPVQQLHRSLLPGRDEHAIRDGGLAVRMRGLGLVAGDGNPSSHCFQLRGERGAVEDRDRRQQRPEE